MIDCPEPKGYMLRNLIPPNRIITEDKEKDTLPPCTKYSLHNKSQPFTLSDASFPIVLQDLQIKISDYSALVVALQKSSPFFVDVHHENVGVEIEEFRVLAGYHNTWMFLGCLGVSNMVASPK